MDKFVTMKLFVVLAATVALCAGSVIPGSDIPTVPGDNSHYVEGQSRYIWFPDGEGVPRLVDLREQPDQEVLTRLATRRGADNAYWLYTRSNPQTPQILIHGNEQSIRNSNFHPSRPIKVIAHGWNNNGNSDVNIMVTQAFLIAGDFNVIVVDWSGLANSNYVTAVLGVPSVGTYIGEFLTWLVATTGANWNTMHLVGHSLGAHVVGNAGRSCATPPARVTGMDPAGPLWGSHGNRILPDSGEYVEAIHTDGGLLGIFDSVADADFYPNGGRNPQPGCWISTCSHSRAYELFAATVLYNHLPARDCGDIGLVSNVSTCTGAIVNLGNSVIPKQGSGLFGLTTGRTWPF